MLKVLLIAACVVLLNGCPFLPPSPYQRTILGDYPSGYIAISPGQRVEGSFTGRLPGYIDIIGASSELNGEVLTATFHLRDLPEKAEFSQDSGHFRLETNHWVVLVSIEGDPLTPMSHLDYMYQSTYYDPSGNEGLFDGTSEPRVTGSLYKCGRTTAPSGKEFTTFQGLADEIEVTFSHEDGALTLVTRVPGITDKSTIAFWTHDSLAGQDYLPRDAD